MYAFMFKTHKYSFTGSADEVIFLQANDACQIGKHATDWRASARPTHKHNKKNVAFTYQIF